MGVFYTYFMNFKLSHYTIITEVVENFRYIVFSTRTGRVVLLNTDNYNHITNNFFEKIDPEILISLIDICAIVPEEENELEFIINENKLEIESDNSLYFVIQPSANCQLGCGYCGQKHSKDQLDEKFEDKIIERLNQQLNKTNKHKHLQIAWFGGEPLMSTPTIRRLTPKLKALAEENNVSYSAKIVTNGLALKKNLFLELINEHAVKDIEITLDGTAEHHDKRRFVKSGEKSFDIIFNNLIDIFNIENYAELGANISIRCNVDKTNYDSVVPLIKLMHEHNFHKRISGFYVAPIHSWGNEAHLVSLEKESYADKEIEWLIEMYKYGFTPSLLPSRNHQVCMIVNPESELIDAFGNIFNCTEVSYVPVYENSPYKLGNIKDIEPNQELKNKPLLNWNDIILNNTNDYPCHTCKMLPVCGGGCPKSWKEGNIACPSPKFNIKDRLALSYLIEEKGNEIFN